MNYFLIIAFSIGILISIVTAPLGCLIIWNRFSYVGDAIAHASLLGVLASILLGINIFFGGLFITIILLILFLKYHSDQYPIETILAIFAYTSLSVALIIYSLNNTIYIDMESLLFGDILANDSKDLAMIASFVILSSIWLKRNWNNLILFTINQEIAQTNGIDCQKLKLKLIILVASLIIFLIKIVGVILIGSLIVIPAASSRSFARSPESMVVVAYIINLFSSILGLLLSCWLDTPSGPSIIIIASLCFFISQIKNYYPVNKT